MKTIVDKKIQKILAEHDIECLIDGQGKTVTIWKQLYGAQTMKHRSLFDAADYFVPILRDSRLTNIVAV